MNERRRDRRFPVEAAAVLKIGKKPLTASVTNVSFHGLSLRVDDPPPLRQLVQVELELPNGKPFSAHAMVVHVDGARVGLEFFGRTSNADWDEFVQGLVRVSLLPPDPAAVVRPPPRPPPAAPPSRRSAELVQQAARAPQAPAGLPQALPLQAPAGPPHAPGAPPPLPPPLPPGRSQPGLPAQPPALPALPAPKAQYLGPDRRRAPRVDLRLELRLRTSRSIHTAFTTTVSMLGATVIVSDGQVASGEQVILNLIQPGTSFSFRRDGVVRSVGAADGGHMLGIEFLPLDPMREVLFAEFMNTAYSAFHPGS